MIIIPNLDAEKYARNVEWNLISLCDGFKEDFKTFILENLDPITINKQEILNLAKIADTSMQEIYDIVLETLNKVKSLYETLYHN